MKTQIERLKEIAKLALDNVRFEVRSCSGTVHIMLDGWDVGTYDLVSLSSGANGSQMELAEITLGIKDA